VETGKNRCAGTIKGKLEVVHILSNDISDYLNRDFKFGARLTAAKPMDDKPYLKEAWSWSRDPF